MNNKIIIQTIFLLFLKIFNGSAKIPNKIYNGNRPEANEFTFEVSIRFMSLHLCAGSIITNKYVLTTASCVTIEPNIAYGNLKILSGTKDLLVTPPNDGKLHEVGWIMLHPDYNPKRFWINDIALLGITARFFFDETYEKVVLPKQYNIPLSILAAGWGGLSFNNQYLTKVGVLTFRRERCKYIFALSDGLHTSQFCGISSKIGAGFTMGDDGNPIIKLDTKIIIGIVSVVQLWPTINYPFVATLVHSHRHFINDIILTY